MGHVKPIDSFSKPDCEYDLFSKKRFKTVKFCSHLHPLLERLLLRVLLLPGVPGGVVDILLLLLHVRLLVALAGGAGDAASAGALAAPAAGYGEVLRIFE